MMEAAGIRRRREIGKNPKNCSKNPEWKRAAPTCAAGPHRERDAISDGNTPMNWKSKIFFGTGNTSIMQMGVPSMSIKSIR